MLNHTDQQAIAQGLSHGDRDAWTRLYDEYSEDVWRYVARLIGADSSTVADVVQEVFLAAAASARNYDATRGTLNSWLLGIAHRQTAYYWRNAARADRWRWLAETGSLQVRQWLDGGDADADWTDRRELADLVRGALAELSADDALLLTGKYIDGLSLEQLALQTGRSVFAIKSKLTRARTEFRRQFERRAGSDQTARLP